MLKVWETKDFDSQSLPALSLICRGTSRPQTVRLTRLAHFVSMRKFCRRHVSYALYRLQSTLLCELSSHMRRITGIAIAAALAGPATAADLPLAAPPAAPSIYMSAPILADKP